MLGSHFKRRHVDNVGVQRDLHLSSLETIAHIGRLGATPFGSHTPEPSAAQGKTVK